jgi:hypothetical protein
MRQARKIVWTSRPLVLGLAAAARINAIEGIQLSKGSERTFLSFEENGLMSEERRRLLIDKHTRRD